MAISSATVLLVAPEFSAEAVDRINAFIEFAKPYIERSVWGVKADHAHALMTAHFLATSPATGMAKGGPVSQEKVGDLSTMYAVNAAKPDSLATSAYGRLLVQLRRTLYTGPLVLA